MIRRTAAEQLGGAFAPFHGLCSLRGWGHAAHEGSGSVEPEPGDRLGRLDAALALLPRRQREVIELRLQHEMTIEAAADALGISIGSARVHYARAKERLRRLIGEEEKHETA